MFGFTKLPDMCNSIDVGDCDCITKEMKIESGKKEKLITWHMIYEQAVLAEHGYRFEEGVS